MITPSAATPAPYPLPFDTAEVRWFAEGKLPSALVEQFCDSGPGATIERRRDLYLVGVSHDVGTKRRDRGRLEVKIRQSFGGIVELGRATPARVEEWRKTTDPETASSDGADEREWSAVDKVVVTRSYGPASEGTVVPVDRDQSAPGCDIEFASVIVEDAQAWTFALEAWGPPVTRRELLHSALAVFAAESPIPDEYQSRLIHAMSYPQWLASVVWSRRRA